MADSRSPFHMRPHSGICLLIGVYKLLMLQVIVDIFGLIAILIAVSYFFLSLFFCLTLLPASPSPASSGLKYFVWFHSTHPAKYQGGERFIYQLPHTCPLLGIDPTTRTCAFDRNKTRDPSVRRMTLLSIGPNQLALNYIFLKLYLF